MGEIESSGALSYEMDGSSECRRARRTWLRLVGDSENAAYLPFDNDDDEGEEEDATRRCGARCLGGGVGVLDGMPSSSSSESSAALT